ncbi:MAG: hypothetical protein AAGE18_16730 [Pseudomonadota bacterium]
MEPISLISGVGVFGIGFVLGWTLYFAIRGRSGQIDAAELTSIAAVVFGGAVTALFEAQPDFLGAYGLGVFAGFTVLFALTLRSLAGLPGRSPAEALERGSPTHRFETQSVRRASSTDAEDDGDTARAFLQRLETDLEVLLQKVAEERQGTEDEERDRLTSLMNYIRAALRQIRLARTIRHLRGEPVVALMTALEEQSEALNKEAERYEQITKELKQFNATLGSTMPVLTRLSGLF